MKFTKVDVKSGKPSRVVAQVEVPTFEPSSNVQLDEREVQSLVVNLGEAFTYFKARGVADPAKEILDLVNTQHGTNLRNEARAPFNQKLTKGKAIEQATAEIDELLGTDEGMAKVKEFRSQPGGIKQWIDNRAEELIKEFDARLKAGGENTDNDENGGE